jgi:hypothetical protein
MLEKFLYICPRCKTYDSLETDDSGKTSCQNCGALFQFADDFRLSVKAGKGEEKKVLGEWYEKIRRVKPPGFTDDAFPKGKGETPVAKSGRAELFQEFPAGMFHGFKTIRARLFRFKKIDEGIVYLTNRRLLIRGERDHEIGLGELASITIESHMVIMNTTRGYAYYLEFFDESGKKWEDLIRDQVSAFYKGKRIREFHPNITFHKAR